MIKPTHTSARPAVIDQIRSDIRKTGSGEVPTDKNYHTEHITISIIPPDGDEPPEDLLDKLGNLIEDEWYYPLAEGDRLMNIKPANLWMAEQRLQPVPKKLFGDFWREGELCLLYADTNMGKSILAVQIGDSLSRGVAIAPFEMDATAAATLYIDFELSAKQFEMRYTTDNAAHRFADEFYRAEYNTQKVKPDHFHTFVAYMQDTINWAIRNTQPRALIIDNITCLSDGAQQNAGTAIAVMKYLKALQIKNKLSILVLAHTPKRDPGKPIDRNDMGGSKMLMNFTDSAFAIGHCFADANLRYLKQVKQRSGSQQYGAENICLCKLDRTNGFLQYQFCGNGQEADHLRRADARQRDLNAKQVADLHRKGHSQRQIAGKLQIGVGTVSRLLAKVKGVV